MSNNFAQMISREVITECEGYTNFPTSSVAILIDNCKLDVHNLRRTLVDLLANNSPEDALQSYRDYLEEYVTSEYLDINLEGTPAYGWAAYTLGLANWKEIALEHLDKLGEAIK